SSGLILFGGYARRSWAPDYAWGETPEAHQDMLESINSTWGNAWAIEKRAASMMDDERFRHWYATLYRLGASPGAALSLARMNGEIDVRHVLPAIRVPTLVLHRRDDRTIALEHGRYLAEHIPGARLV